MRAEVLYLFLLLSWLLPTACDRGPGGAPAAAQTSESPTVTAELPELPCSTHVRLGQVGGVCYAHNWQDGGSRGYGSAMSNRSLEEIAGLGLTAISLTPFGWQDGLSGTEVRYGTIEAGESDDRLRRTIETAHELGLIVIMKPHIWIDYTHWRGHIEPAGDDGWDRWFASYEPFIMHYAELSREAGADMLVIGVELASSATRFPERWRALIARIREVYDGPLIYAANWDSVERIEWWDAVDYIGVQMFAPLAETPDASLESLRSAANEYLVRYTAVSARFERPLILTEVGFKAVDGTTVLPYMWPEHLPTHGTHFDPLEQVMAYCAILETFGQSNEVAGMYWWKWFADPDTDEEDELGFSPRGKPAEALLRAAYARP